MSYCGDELARLAQTRCLADQIDMGNQLAHDAHRDFGLLTATVSAVGRPSLITIHLHRTGHFDAFVHLC